MEIKSTERDREGERGREREKRESEQEREREKRERARERRERDDTSVVASKLASALNCPSSSYISSNMVFASTCLEASLSSTHLSSLSEIAVHCT